MSNRPKPEDVKARLLEEHRAQRRSPAPWVLRADYLPPDPPEVEPPELGAQITFVPAANDAATNGFGELLGRPVTGTVVQIHAEHRWYRVAFQMGTRRPGCIGYECFKY